MTSIRMTAALAGLAVLVSALHAPAQAPDDKTAKAREMIRQKWEARAAELAKGADADHDGSVSESEFGPLWDAAGKEKHEIVHAVCAELGLAEAPPPHHATPGKPAGGGKKKAGKKGGGKAGGKKQGSKPDPAKQEEAHKAEIAEAFRKADGDANGKVTPEEAAHCLASEVKADNDPTAP